VPDENEEDQLRAVAFQNASSIFAAKNRQDELRAQLAAIVESSDDAIITKSLQSIIHTWNQGAERIFGYKADEVVGKSILILIPPDRIDEESRILGQLKRGERINHYETVRVRKDGRRIEISLSVSPIKDSTGKIVGASKIARDITSRKRMEEALRESESRLRAVVEATPECVKIVSCDGSLLFMNPAGIQMIEAKSLEAVSGASVFDLIAPEHRDHWLDRHTSICKGEKHSWEFEVVGLRGTRRWMETHAVPLTLGDGTNGMLAVTRDITSRKLAEVEREQLLEQERAARSEAERVGLIKDEFLANLSHELRTPLNAILGWAQILRRRNYEDKELVEGLAVIERNTRVQVQLIEDLLDMSRIISGKIRLDVQQVDLQDAIKSAVASVQHAADAKGIRLHTVLDPRAGPVRGDPARLQQCILNLLTNAIKFTSRDGKVQIALERINSHIEITVVDNGRGIKPEFLPHIFERFRQADSSTTRMFGGLGLGLSIVKHLVELHGGKITAHSDGEGKGATFRIELPLLIAHVPDHSSPREHPRTPNRAANLDAPSLEGITVLAVDDEMDARNVVKRILEECGAKVITAGSAQEAFEMLPKASPDMIICDIGMPIEDGYQFIRRVRALPKDQGSRTPAAALTAFARAEDRTRALLAGFQTHVAKPVEPTELIAVVASLAARR